MVQFEKVNVESALLFEGIEQMYARVFRSIKPRTPLPHIVVAFRKYANATSRINLQDGTLKVFVSDLLEGAPAPIQESLAHILISKLFRKTPEPSLVARYNRYLNRADVRRTLHLVKQVRGRKQLRNPKGDRYDLREIFEELNWRYFQGLMGQPQLGWSLRPSSTTLGHFDPSHNVIVLSSILDCARAPELIVKFVLFHEMLHLKYPTEHRGARRCVHTAEFKAAEREFENFERARAELRLFVQNERGEKY